MKISSKIETIIIVALYLFTLYLWSLPYHENRMPYGEVDAGSHFTLGDYMASTNKPIITLPYFIDKRYGEDNKFKAHILWYHPPYHVNFAIMQIIGGERVLPIFFFNTLLSSIIVIITYFLMRKLFGFWPALLSSFILIFSMRDIMIYLFGQWPQQIAYFYTPLILYVFYKYTNSYLEKNEKKIYAYLLPILLAINFFMHPMAFFHTAMALIVFSILLLIKERKLFFSIKSMSIAIILFLLIIAIFPYQTGNVFAKSTASKASGNPYVGDFSRFFYWFGMYDFYKGRQPDTYFSYSDMIGGWTLPLLLIGILFLLIKRDRKSWLLISYLIGTYLMIHLIFFGTGRPERSLAASAHIFYPLIVLGLLAIPGLLAKLAPGLKKYIKYGIILLFFVLVLSFNYKPAYNQLKEAYQPITRANPYQYEAAEWLKDNVPENSNILAMGVIMTQKTRWLRYLSQRYIYDEGEVTPNYLFLDYSDLILLQNDQRFKQKLDELTKYEAENLENQTIVYNKNNIKVYKLEN